MFRCFREDFETFVSRREVIRYALSHGWQPSDGNPYDFLDWMTGSQEEELDKIYWILKGLPRSILAPWVQQRTGVSIDDDRRLAGALLVHYKNEDDEDDFEAEDPWWIGEHAMLLAERPKPKPARLRKRAGKQ